MSPQDPPGFIGVVLFAAISALILWLAKRSGFYKPLHDSGWKPDLQLWQVVLSFAIYFAVSIFVPGLIAPIVQLFSPPQTSQIGFVSWLNLLTCSAIFGGLIGLWKGLPKRVRHSIWRSETATQSYGEDFKFAFYAWCISFPVVLFASQLLDYLVFIIFKVTQLPDQIAVYFVKMTFSHPLYFILALLSIVILAPLVEELLFRGFLQTFIRKHLGSNQAIVITALCFAFFHFSPEQGLGNIPIVGSLFSLALFLGYLYERQGSLFAPMALHALFNTISILNLYFLGGAPRGAL